MALAETPHHANPVDALQAQYVRDHTRQLAYALLWTLFDLDGELRSASGNANRELVAEAHKLGYRIPPYYLSMGSGLSQVIREMDHGRFAGLVSRELGSRKTYAIKLLLTEDQMPPRPARLSIQAIEANGGPTDPRTTQEPKPPQQAPVTTPSVPPELPETPEPKVDDPQPEPDVEAEQLTDEATLLSVPSMSVEATEPIDALLMIQHLAMQAALGIASVIGQVPAPAPEGDEMDAIKVKLAETLEENQRLRLKCNANAETAHAKAKECDALRKALMVSSSNLKAMQQASGQGPELERKLANLKQVQRFVAEPPKAKAMV
jgi:hypothetical protein